MIMDSLMAFSTLGIISIIGGFYIIYLGYENLLIYYQRNEF